MGSSRFIYESCNPKTCPAKCLFMFCYLLRRLVLAGLLKILLTSKSSDKFFYERAMWVATGAFLKAERASCYPGRPLWLSSRGWNPALEVRFNLLVTSEFSSNPANPTCYRSENGEPERKYRSCVLSLLSQLTCFTRTWYSSNQHTFIRFLLCARSLEPTDKMERFTVQCDEDGGPGELRGGPAHPRRLQRPPREWDA